MARPARHRGLRELGIFAAAYLTYFGVRALTEERIPDAQAHAADLRRLERQLGLDVEGDVQEAILGHNGVTDVVNAVYIYGHWPLLIVGGILLFHFAREHYYVLRNVCLVSGAVGLVIFALYPVAPPRLAGTAVDTVTERAETYRTVLPSSLVNEYAAMPSFHAGWNLALGILLFAATRHLLLRVLAVAGPAAMVFAVVATGNHYVVDVAAGAAIVVASLLAVRRVERLGGRRTLAADGPRGAPTAGARHALRRRPPGRQRPLAPAAGGRRRGPAHRG